MPRFLVESRTFELTQAQLDAAPESVLTRAAECSTSEEDAIALSSWSSPSAAVFEVQLSRAPYLLLAHRLRSTWRAAVGGALLQEGTGPQRAERTCWRHFATLACQCACGLVSCSKL